MPAHDSPTVAARRARLQDWIDTHYGGSQASFIAAIKINQGELSLLLKNKSFGEKKASALEAAAKMPNGYLVNPIPVVPSQFLGLDAAIIRQAITLAKKSFKLAHDEELVIERDPELFAQALVAALAKRQKMGAKSGTRSGSGNGQVGATSRAARTQEDGAEAGTEISRKRKRAS